ncbi:tRNA lysidine(34) synthetase TilS [Flavobacterium dauae]|uniref:tRNA lysidine(34) synthetase TilS n=1 Tax=Flavobacterium dauae TaxID=1563479 RepID=UPI00101B3267|nr:tRNA lysidine(34) synthetase TilS [Flavobacterium dauae]WLD24894.1 tRNA lysidine(34) synthetase TilS [Flavobacterium dauae]
MLNQFKQHIVQKFPESVNGKTLLAVSGGVDSMVLLHLYLALQLDFAVAHCNFQLRGTESDLDEKLVADFCKENNIPCFVERFDTMQIVESSKVSIQIAARELRYNWFKQICINYGYQFIATAHHLDDQAETFLINFTRGTGIDGLVGIPEKNESIIRPLLNFSREEILNYATENRVEWREDQSNATTKYLRNKMRHLVLPVLKEENIDFLKSFKNTLNNLKQTQILANDAIVFFEKECVTKTVNQTEIDLEKAESFPNKIYYLVQVLMKYGFDSIKEIEKIYVAESGKVLKNDKFTILKNREKLIIFKENESNSGLFYINDKNDVLNLPFFIKITEVGCEQFNTNKSTIFVNSEFLKWPLILRRKKTGDFFYPFGMSGIKKVSKFFKDEKLSKIQKENMWILENGDGKIIWVVGLRADDRFKITSNNQEIYKITLNQ